MLRLLFAILCAAAACMLVAGALSSAQTTTSTPDVFLTQVTSTARNSHATDISANGRFVVFESEGDASTLRPTQTVLTKSPENTDGNSEIFLYDYAQRRVFQLTNTRGVLNPAGSPTPTPSPSPSPSVSPSPTASPTATPVDPRNIKIEITNREPMISAEPALVAGARTYTIVFKSNAPVSPAFFDGTDPGAPTNTDMNTEIWTYQFTVPEIADLSQGADVAFQDLSTGTFTRITNTPASKAPSAGSITGCFQDLGCAPQIAHDNREATISDDGQVIAFTSTRDLLLNGSNVDSGGIQNPEVFLFNRGTGIFTQATSTVYPVLNQNPNLAGSGGSFTLAFSSTGNLAANNSDGNAEIFVATYNGAAIVSGSLRQITRTTDTTGVSVLLSLGRRLSRDGRWIAFESKAANPTANATTNTIALVSFVCDLLANPAPCTQVAPRATSGEDVRYQFPGFTDYTGTSPGTVVFSSALNFKSDGTLLAPLDNTGLNPASVSQLFAASLPVTAQPTGPFTRLTDIQGTNVLAPLNSLPSNSRRRIAFTYGGAELGGGNPDFLGEVFYNLVPAATTQSSATISVFTGASLIPVASPSPTASPSGSPSPSPSPSPTGSPGTGPLVAPGLAAGELAVINSSASLAPSTVTTANASVTGFAPPLPTELRGVSVSIRGAAAGLYSVSPTQISFVVPRGLPAGVYPLVINNNGTVIRGNIAIVGAAPDIFTSSNGAGGRAFVFDVTNPAVEMAEPFTITSTTTLRVVLTGVQNVNNTQVQIRIGTTDITGTAILSGAVQRDQPGFYQIDFRPPTSLAGAGDVPIIVTVTVGGVISTSRPASSAPLIRIN